MKWLDSKSLNYQLIDIVNDPPSIRYLDLALNQYLEEKKKLFNTRGKSFKLINFDILTLSNKEIIQLLSSDGTLVKRPFLVNKGRDIILGFNEAEYTKRLL